jgi:ABC-type multidrug transport system fused ATPase/permease subunit
LPFADWIVVLNEGSIVSQGTYTNLLEKGIDFTKILLIHEQHLEKMIGEEEGGASPESLKEKEEKRKAMQEGVVAAAEDEEKESKGEVDGSLMQVEENAKGEVPFYLYVEYFKSGGTVLFFMVIFLFLFSQSLRVASDYWLVLWSSKKKVFGEELSTTTHILIYFSWFLLHAIFLWIRERLLVRECENASRTLHQQMLASIVAAKIHFFDSNPIGRIINRFSKDFYFIDTNLSQILSDVCFLFLAFHPLC